MSRPMIFRTHGPSGVQHSAINREWSAYSQTLDLTGYTREQREALRDAFYAGAVAAKSPLTNAAPSLLAALEAVIEDFGSHNLSVQTINRMMAAVDRAKGLSIV